MAVGLHCATPDHGVDLRHALLDVPSQPLTVTLTTILCSKFSPKTPVQRFRNHRASRSLTPACAGLNLLNSQPLSGFATKKIRRAGDHLIKNVIFLTKTWMLLPPAGVSKGPRIPEMGTRCGHIPQIRFVRHRPRSGRPRRTRRRGLEQPDPEPAAPASDGWGRSQWHWASASHS